MENNLITLDESQKALTADSIEYIDAVTRQAAALDREVKAIKTKLLGLMGAHGISKIETDTTMITLVVPETPKPREVFDVDAFKQDNEFCTRATSRQSSPTLSPRTSESRTDKEKRNGEQREQRAHRLRVEHLRADGCHHRRS